MKILYKTTLNITGKDHKITRYCLIIRRKYVNITGKYVNMKRKYVNKAGKDSI